MRSRRTILNRATLARHSKRKGETQRSPAKRAKTAGRPAKRDASRAKLKRSARISPLKSAGAVSTAPSAGKNGGHAVEEEPTDLRSVADTETRIRDLIKLSKEQGYLTFDDLNDSLPDGISDADELDVILTRLRRMEIDII